MSAVLSHTTIDAALDNLALEARGALLRPHDPGYEPARHIWNGMVDKRPAAILRCTGAADVIAGIHTAREHGVPLAVKGNGHNVAGTALCDGGLVLDLSAMKGIRIDPERRTVLLQPGITNGDFDHETQAFGLSATTGIASTTGLSGLTLGGGIGWLMRKFGLTCDHLLSADLVTASGSLVHTSADEHAELFWGIRGGGGNFGVATSFEFQLRPLGPTVMAGIVLHPAERAHEVLRFYREFIAGAPDEVTCILNLRHAPAAAWVPEHLHGTPVVGIVVCYAGPVEEGAEVLQPLKAYGPPLVDLIAPKPYTLHQRMFDAAVPPGWRYYWKSHYLANLDDAVLDTVIAHAWASRSPRSYTLIPQMGGAVARVPAEATAMGHRTAGHAININGVWVDEVDDGEEIAWTRAFFDAMTPHATGGVYVNFLMEEGEERVRAAYGDAAYQRLAALKQEYDPANLFRTNQNIAPAP